MLNLFKKQNEKVASHEKTLSQDIPQFKVRYNSDRLMTAHLPFFLQDEKFVEAYELGKATGSFHPADPSWRTYICCWAAKQAENVPGDFVECGVNKGGISRAVIHYTDFQSLNKTFYLLDTFCGTPEEHMLPQQRERYQRNNKQHWYEESYEQALNTFGSFNTRIIKGKVPETLTQVDTDKVAYLSIDMNAVYPEVEALRFFWPKLSPGAVVVLDDYAWAGHEPQREALDELGRELGFLILNLPTGQGLIFKHPYH